ncbi:MAG: glutamine--fructose-6-phosphate transaminase (isomerizing) [Christensenellales bacterium]
MCGIFGYIGNDNAICRVISGLEKLEYRGYDSAGLAYVKQGEIKTIKSIGKVENLKISSCSISSKISIAHTRWATHGSATEKNCHPHTSENFAIVHNGIIENFEDLKRKLNYEFYSETDTEVVAKLLEEKYRECRKKFKVEDAVLHTIKETQDCLKGSWAIALICKLDPKKIYVFKNKSPIVVGIGKNESCVSSDINAIESDEFNFYNLEDGNIAVVKQDDVKFYDKNLNPTKLERIRQVQNKYFEDEIFSHKMIKEINEIPFSIHQTAKIFDSDEFITLSKRFKKFKEITIIGCGTAYHAGLYGKYILEKYVGKKVDVVLASEYRYKTKIKSENELVIAISQSGETADTLAGVILAKESGATTVAITNVSSSSITRECNFTLLTNAGPERAVAATKSYVCQIYVLYLLACKIINKTPQRDLDRITEKFLKAFNGRFFEKYYSKQKFFFIGRLCDSSTAFEGALKLKEIAYVHSEGYPAGELKHGTLSLVDEKSLVVAILTQNIIKEKTLNAVHEVLARGADVILITQFHDIDFSGDIITLPNVCQEIAPLVSVIPLQLFSYHYAIAKGLNPDMPRHLAKSVTVE